MTELVLQERHGAVTLLTLNRPEKLNALNYALIDSLMSHLDAIEDDATTGAVILTGAGERAFSAPTSPNFPKVCDRGLRQQ